MKTFPKFIPVHSRNLFCAAHVARMFQFNSPDRGIRDNATWWWLSGNSHWLSIILGVRLSDEQYGDYRCSQEQTTGLNHHATGGRQGLLVLQGCILMELTRTSVCSTSTMCIGSRPIATGHGRAVPPMNLSCPTGSNCPLPIEFFVMDFHLSKWLLACCLHACLSLSLSLCKWVLNCLKI